ncbi:tRNA uridine-5-carboxymethylaminomethyl(34) synthesis GTPase MnmE [Hephaestia sp. GCM10023244]|uniref:tRNA uridine-5-carboxymethylaminomethyl(34) synthesis GTPase MnmE n=1 Tax=unclassified Hephaestia TaxID=2631281 RepID=UPI002076EB2D|nr:tRNA uridine-5-carboxymethylaminomethyl(34) synthesis GTPase MnmE [Hephaestia sp. MAHUQ-44]MCM8731147.1 tRNA uridine-5-carboxymethylaminomethyl(34) synthesis GTPase MnmE [Hephaestia sp. MAHUQ-44]
MAALAADTIVALSSGAPPAAIGIIRLSGPDAFAVAAAVAGPLPAPREAVLRGLRGHDGMLLDRALVLAFAAPATATGEDLVEFHCHGGRAVVAAVEAALLRHARVRRAEPGEFTRRALAAGRIDLAQAEGLGDLLAAETETQRRAAMATAEGAISRAVTGWTRRLVVLAAQVEAAIDFSDEDDVAVDLTGVTADGIALADEMAALLDAPTIERLRDGIRIVLAGAPNTGKSTLLNALVEREAAIVSPISGTTRDRIEIPVARDGIAYVFTDTAGLRDTSDDPIELIGIDRARDAIEAADIVLWLDDAPPPANANALPIHARVDMPERKSPPSGRLVVSAATGEGIIALWHALAARATALLPRLDQPVLNQRQRDLCRLAYDELAVIGDVHDPLIVAERLRRARVALDRITGRAGTEDMLDALFSRFCIGK